MNKKIGLLFAGQGSQYINMGLDFYNNYPYVQDLFKEANQILAYTLEDIIFKENEKINQTKYTQAAIVVVSCAIYEVFKKEFNLKVSSMAGFSLGEYSALYASGVYNFSELVYLIKYRAKFMDESAIKNPGKMAAIIGIDYKDLQRLCDEVGGVYIANYNTFEQLVVGGYSEKVNKLCELAVNNGAKRAVELNVSGAFHTPLMAEACDKMRTILTTVNPKQPNCDIINNYNAKKLEDINNLNEYLTKQISSPVLFLDTIQLMIDDGIDSFIEIGPGKVLSGFLRRIDRSKQVFNIAMVDDLENIKKLEGI